MFLNQGLKPQLPNGAYAESLLCAALIRPEGLEHAALCKPETGSPRRTLTAQTAGRKIQ